MKKLTLLVATAKWCSTCKPYKQVLEQLDQEVYSIKHLDVDETSSDSLKLLGIRGVPTSILYDQEDKELGRNTGAMNLTQLNKWIGITK